MFISAISTLHMDNQLAKHCISEEGQAWWITYLETLEKFCQNYSVNCTFPTWPLNRLVATTSVQVAPIQSASSPPPEYLMSLQRKETGTHPEVCNFGLQDLNKVCFN